MTHSHLARPGGKFPEVWGRIPPRNKNFTGRAEQLDLLRRSIDGQVTAVLPYALQGLGGVGKTLISVEYAHQYRAEYDLVWWIPADQPGLVRSTLAQLAPYLDVPSPVTTGIDDAANAVLEALRRGEPYSRWLLIFDNADEPEDINELIPRGPGHVLITSRNHRWQGVVETVPVDVFPRAESIDFLRKRVPRSLGDRDADRLAEALGDLPLALEQAGALQAETGMPIDEYLNLLRKRTAQLLREGKPTEYPMSMTAAWELSVGKLQETLPEAVELLRSCAFFGPEPIPRDVFFPVDDSAVRPEVAELLEDPIRLSKVFGALGRYALVRIDNSGRTIQVHRLIQALLREELDTSEQDDIRAEVCALLAAPNTSQLSASNRFLELLAHLRPARIAESTRPPVREFALTMLEQLNDSGDYASTKSYIDYFLPQWRADSGENDPHVLRAQLIQGTLLRNLGRFDESYELDNDTLERMRTALGETDRYTLVVRNGIGAGLRARGRFHEALSQDEEMFRLHESSLGSDHRSTLNAMNSYALDHVLTSDYEGARALHERVYMALKRSGDTDATSIVAYWNGLARSVQLCGDFTEACDVSEEVLAYAREQLGADHPRTLHAQKELAVARRMSGEYEDALEIIQDVHGRLVRLYGINHPDTLAAAMCLSNVQRVMGDLDPAMELATDTARRYSNVYGPQHPSNFGCHSNVALLNRLLGDAETARMAHETALAGLEVFLGRDHHFSLGVAVNLASDLAKLGDTKNAVKLGRGTHRRLTALLGADHPTTLICASNLVLDLRAEGEAAEADELGDATAVHSAQKLGREHPISSATTEGRRYDYTFDPPPF